MKSMWAPARSSSDSSVAIGRPRSTTWVTPRERGLAVRSGRARKSARASSPSLRTASRRGTPGNATMAPRVPAVPVLQILELRLSGPEPAELDEQVVEEQLVQVAHLVDGDAPAHELVEVLEGVLHPEADVVGADDPAGVAVDEQLAEPGELRVAHGVEHAGVADGHADVLVVEALRRHLDLDHVAVLLPGLPLRQPAPRDLVGGVEEVGVLGVVPLPVLAHDVASGDAARLAGLEHLERRADEVADGVDVGHRRLHGPVDLDVHAVVDLDAEGVDEGLRLGPLAGGDEDEVAVPGLDLPGGIAELHAGRLAVAEHLEGLDAFEDLGAPQPHALDDVVAEVVVDVVQALGAHQRAAGEDRRLDPGRLEEGAVLDGHLGAADDHAPARL